MSKCPKHKLREATKFCIGCNQLFCDECVEQVKGVYFCHGCQDKAKDFESSAPYEEVNLGADDKGKYQVHDNSEDKKWERTFDTSSIMTVTSEQIKNLKEPIPIEDNLADIGHRLGAYVMDIVLLSPIFFILNKMPSWTNKEMSIPEETWPFVAGGLTYLFLIIYRFIFLGWGGRTFGMMLADVKAVDGMGHDIGPGKGLVRTIITILIDIPVLGWLAGLLTAMLTPMKQCLNDILSGNYVVRYGAWHRAACDLVSGKTRKPQMDVKKQLQAMETAARPVTSETAIPPELEVKKPSAPPPLDQGKQPSELELMENTPSPSWGGDPFNTPTEENDDEDKPDQDKKDDGPFNPYQV